MRRSSILALLLAALIGWAWLRPAPSPQKPLHPRWVKLDADGRPMAAWAGPWQCVLDTKTELVWEVKSYREDIHDRQCSFSWFDGVSGEAGKGDCFVGDGDSDTRDIASMTNREQRCGLTTWRLPSETELRSLVIDTPLPGDLFIARDYFPYTQRGPYWSADTVQGKGARSFSYLTRKGTTMPFRDATFVRLVAAHGAAD